MFNTGDVIFQIFMFAFVLFLVVGWRISCCKSGG